MKIKVVAGQIREDRGGKAATPQTVLRQRMGTGFQYGVGATRVHHFGKKSLQLERLRRGGGGRAGLKRRAIGDGAE